MSKIARILTALVAALPAAAFLYVFFLGGVVESFTSMPTAMKVGTAGAGVASVVLALLPILTAAGLFSGGPKKPKAKKIKKPKKAKKGKPEEVEDDFAEDAADADFESADDFEPADSGDFATDDSFADDSFADASEEFEADDSSFDEAFDFEDEK